MARGAGSVTRRVLSDRAALREGSSPALKEALETLTAGGMRATEISVEALVTAAGMSRSAFYRHYADKGDLLVHLMQAAAADILEAAGAWWSLPPHPTDDDLLEAQRVVFGAYERHRVVFAAALEVATYDDRVRDEYDALVGVCAAGLSEHISTGQAAGLIDPQLDPARAASWLTWMAERGYYRLAGAAGDADADVDVDAHLRDLTRIVANTLYARGA